MRRTQVLTNALGGLRRVILVMPQKKRLRLLILVEMTNLDAVTTKHNCNWGVIKRISV